MKNIFLVLVFAIFLFFGTYILVHNVFKNFKVLTEQEIKTPAQRIEECRNRPVEFRSLPVCHLKSIRACLKWMERR